MKTQSNNLLQQLGQREIKELALSVVEERLAGGKKTFSAADLWNIQRMRRTRTQRRLIAG